MSDRVRIVRLHQPSGRLWIERDLEIEYGKYQRAAGTFRISASAPTLSTAEQSRSRVAPRTYGRTDPARTATGTWRVRGDTYNECIANAEAILGAVDSGRAGRMIEWRPDGHTVSTLLKVTGPGTWTSNYTWHQFFQNRGIDFDLAWPVEPMSYSQPWDVYDEFDPLADDWNVPATQLLVNANGASPLGTTAGYKTAGPGSAGFVNSTYTQEFGIGFTYGGWDQLSGAGFESLVGDPGTGTWTILAPDPTVGSPAFQEAIAPVTPGKWYALRCRIKPFLATPNAGATFGPVTLVASMFGPGPGAGVEQQAALIDAGGLRAQTSTDLTAAINGQLIDLCGIIQIPAGIDRIGTRIQVAMTDAGAASASSNVVTGNLGVWPIAGPGSTIPGDPYVTGDSDGWRWIGDRNHSGWTRLAESKLQEWTFPVGRKGAIARGRRNFAIAPDTRDSLPWEWLAIHDGRNVPSLTDDYAAVEFTVPPDVNRLGATVGIVFAYKNSGDYLLCQLELASTWRLRLYYRYGGTFNLLDEAGYESTYGTSTGYSIQPGFKYTIQVSRRGAKVVFRLLSRYGMEMFGQYNAPAGATYPAGGGKAGIRMAGQWADDTADMIIRSFTREPLTYESYDPDLAGTFTPFPHAWPLPTLPGDIDGPPALADFRFTPAAQGGSSDVGQGAWACLGWAARDGGHNMLGVGSFDEEGTGNLKYVFATARAPIVAGATVIGTDAWAPTANGEHALGVRTTAANQGAWLEVPGPFLSGRTYRLSVKLLGLPYDHAIGAAHGAAAVGNANFVNTAGTTPSSALGGDLTPAPPNYGSSPTATKVVADGTTTNQGRSFALGTLPIGLYRVRLWVRNLSGDNHLTVALGKTTTPFEQVNLLNNAAVATPSGWTLIDQYVNVTVTGDYVLYARHNAASVSSWVTFSEQVQRINSPLAATLVIGRYGVDSALQTVQTYRTSVDSRPESNYQEFSVDWTASTDWDRAYVQIQRSEPGTERRDIEVDSVQVYEMDNGLRRPAGEGADGYSPIGRIPASPFYLSNASNWQNGSVPGSLKLYGPNDGLHSAAGSSSTWDPATLYDSGYLEWPIDPGTIMPAEGDVDVTVEVYACYTISSTENATLRAHLQLRGSYGIGSNQDAQPWGAAGRPLLRPASGTNIQKYSRLGTLTMSGRDRKWLRFWTQWTGALPAVQADRFQLNYLCLVPIRQRACLPTGKPNAAGLYPRWVGGGGHDWERIWYSDLSGAENWRDTQRGGPAPALGGEPIELPTGRPLWFMPWVTYLDGGVPDGPVDPFALGEAGADVPGGRWHLAITPRRNLLVPDERG